MPEPRWYLEDPIAALDRWAAEESPATDLRYVVTEWVFALVEKPFKVGKREPGFTDLWFAVIPGSYDGNGRLVTCSYWVDQAHRLVRVDRFASLNPPFMEDRGYDWDDEPDEE